MPLPINKTATDTMRNFRLFAFLFCLLPALALAQRFVPEGLTQVEKEALELRGVNDVALNGWSRFVGYYTSVEQLRRAGLLARCEVITRAGPDDFYFDPAFRAALNGVVDKIQAGKILPSSLQDFRYHARVALWAARHTSPADWRAVLQLAQSPAGRVAQQRIRAIIVIEGYEEYGIDTATGKPLAYPPIALKAYFVQSGQLDVFNRALRAIDPALEARFARVGTLEQHTAADLPWLQELNLSLNDKTGDISKAFLDSLPEGERKAIAALNQTAFYSLLEDANVNRLNFAFDPKIKPDDPKFRGLAPGMRDKPLYDDFVSASIADEYRLPPESSARLLRMGPAQYIDSAHLAFCPAK